MAEDELADDDGDEADDFGAVLQQARVRLDAAAHGNDRGKNLADGRRQLKGPAEQAHRQVVEVVLVQHVPRRLERVELALRKRFWAPGRGT